MGSAAAGVEGELKGGVGVQGGRTPTELTKGSNRLPISTKERGGGG